MDQEEQRRLKARAEELEKEIKKDRRGGVVILETAEPEPEPPVATAPPPSPSPTKAQGLSPEFVARHLQAAGMHEQAAAFRKFVESYCCPVCGKSNPAVIQTEKGLGLCCIPCSTS